MLSRKWIVAGVIGLSWCLSAGAELPVATDKVEEVMQTEQAFADTMAKRNFEGFLSFLSEEAIFFSASKPLRGKAQVGQAWKPYFEGTEAPFSWEPELVEVLDSGTLALSSGPVRNSEGKVVGRFNSIWRYEPQSERWKIVFDKGGDVCDDASP